MLQKSTNVSVVSEVFEAWTAFRRGLQRKILKRKRPNSRGSSSASSSRSLKRRAIQKPGSDPSSAATSPPSKSEMDSNNSTPSSTARLGLLSTGSSSGSPKTKKRDQVRRVFRKFQRKRSSDSTSSGGGSDTSIEGDSPRRIRTSVVPEVTITPSSDSSTAASPTASVRTIFRVNPHTGKPATQCDLGHLVPPPAANSRRRQRKRAETTQAFPKRSSSLRASLDFPFNPEKAAEQHDESHLYHTNSSCLNMGTGTLPSERPESLVTPSLKSAKSTISNYSLDKPLPALPKDKRSSVLDFYSKKRGKALATPSEVLNTPTKPSRTPASNECLIDFSTESNNDNDNTPRPLAWPLPTAHQSIYGSGGITTHSPLDATSTVGIDDDNDIGIDEDDNNDAADAASTPRPRCRANSGSSELSKYGFQFYKPLDPRVIDARLRQHHRSHSPPLTPTPSPSKTVTTPDDFPTPPSSSLSRKPDAYADAPCTTAHPALHNRNSVVSVLSTADSFVTATEEVGGEESGAEGAAEDADPFAELGTDDAFVDADPEPQLAVCGGDADEHTCNPFEDSGIATNKSDYDSMNPAAFPDDPTAPAVTATTTDEPEAEEDAHDEARIPTDDDINNLPFRVTTTGPFQLSTKLSHKVIKWEFDHRDVWHTPEWKTEPDSRIIKDTVRPYLRLCGLSTDDIKIELLAEGRWNRVYTISALDKDTNTVKECIFRCALPDLPWYRTQIEVSTMEFVRHNTTIPVPKIFAFNSSMKSTLGLEWILMEKIQGTPYSDAEDTFSFETKAKFHRTVAEWVDQLSRLQFDQIGSLYRHWSKPLSDKASYQPGPLNDEEFKTDLRLDHDVYRGPYANMAQYLHCRIGFRLAEALDPRMKKRASYWAERAKFEEAQAEGEQATAEFNINPEIEDASDPQYDLAVLDEVPLYCIRLQSLPPIIFGNYHIAPASAPLTHMDIHGSNILVDDEGKPLALLDWEQALTMPIEWTPRYPKFIDTEEYAKPELWTIIGPKPRYQAQEEVEYERSLLRFEFDKRLEELASPFLEERANRINLDIIENHLVTMRFACMDDDYTPEIKERALKALKG